MSNPGTSTWATLAEEPKDSEKPKKLREPISIAPEEVPSPQGDVVEPTDSEALDPGLPVPRAEEVLAAVEALLFSATTPLTPERIGILLNGVPVLEVEGALIGLRERYALSTSGLMLMEVGGGLQLATKAELADWVLRLHKHRKRNPLTPSLLESLAIIAYKQPLTRADIEIIRGVDCGTALRSLQDSGLVEVIGRKEVVGRPPLYGTTELFLKTFGLKDLEELPSLQEHKPTLAPPPTD